MKFQLNLFIVHTFGHAIMQGIYLILQTQPITIISVVCAVQVLSISKNHTRKRLDTLYRLLANSNESVEIANRGTNIVLSIACALSCKQLCRSSSRNICISFITWKRTHLGSRVRKLSVYQSQIESTGSFKSNWEAFLTCSTM